jgi:GDP-L-fucose synthase
MKDFFADKRVVVTGGAGFLGSYVVRKLQERGCASIVVPRRAACDLRKWEAVDRLLGEVRPHLVIHLAATVSGIGGTLENPGGSFYDNLIMGVQVLEAARQRDVEKVVVLGTVCSYPEFVPVPAHEEDLWNGCPEEANAPYGLAKRILLVQSKAYRQQYGLNSICLIAANLYGPGDHFESATSHVIPALIRRFFAALRSKEREVICWGDGAATCDFLYVEDCADAILLASELYDASEPVNIASGHEISIQELAEEIARRVNFDGQIIWDRSKPGGQGRRCWDASRAERAFGFRARKDFLQGLEETIAWYQEKLCEEHIDEPSYAGLSQHQRAGETLRDGCARE